MRLTQDRILSHKKSADANFKFPMCPSWFQGRGAFGGLLMAQAIRALNSCDGLESKGMILSSLSGSFMQSHQGESVEIEIQPLRLGRGTHFIQARLYDADSIVADFTLTLSRPRQTSVASSSPTMPEAEPFEKCLEAPAGLVPAFVQHFDMRMCPSLIRPKDSLCTMWVEPKSPTKSPYENIALSIDALPPTVFLHAGPHFKGGTVHISLHFWEASSKVKEEGAFLVQSRGGTRAEGWLEEHQDLWSASGEHLASSTQQIAFFTPSP